MLRIILPFALLVSLVAQRPVQAGCVQPSYRILWSYPADGAVDIPTNARLFILSSFGLDTAEIKVNGTSVTGDPAAPRPGYALSLRPNTEYVVTMERDLFNPITTGLRFTTGAGPRADTLPTPPVVDRAASMPARPLSGVCYAARSIGFCFDTGDPGQLVLETKSQAVLFLLRWQPPAAYPEWVPQSIQPPQPYTINWPATCGQPAVFGNTTTCFGSYRITAVGLTGEFVSSDYDCPEPRDPRTVTTTETASGCSLSGARGTGPGALLLLAGLSTILARRSRSPSRCGCRRPGWRTGVWGCWWCRRCPTSDR